MRPQRNKWKDSERPKTIHSYGWLDKSAAGRSSLNSSQGSGWIQNLRENSAKTLEVKLSNDSMADDLLCKVADKIRCLQRRVALSSACPHKNPHLMHQQI
mmetsp:Transcript_28135/g.57978  ORF Transcript_28135/g.57978 Transcript_28135/m.57978 type:complete len:100 (+) Transcript_28135:75-374(+)